MTSLFHGKDQNISTRVSGEKLQTNRQMEGISNYLIFVGPTKFSQTWGLHSIFTGFALCIHGVFTLHSRGLQSIFLGFALYIQLT